jgi:hypothetical protein
MILARGYRSLCIVAILLFLGGDIAHAGDFGEHKKIGDMAFRRLLKEEPNLVNTIREILACDTLSSIDLRIPLDRGLTFFPIESTYQGQLPLIELVLHGKQRIITYGDLTGLAGDHSVLPLNLLEAIGAKSGFTWSNSAIYPDLQKDALEHLQLQWESLNRGERGVNPLHADFASLAIEDKSHFHLPKKTLEQELSSIESVDQELIFEKLLYEPSAYRDDAVRHLFTKNVAAKYALLHVLARSLWRSALDADSLATRRDFLRMALVSSAFADHYLQDMFSGGHFFVDRHASDPLGLEARGRHDLFGRVGVQTTLAGSPVTLYGDGKLTEEQFEAAIQATMASMRNVFVLDGSEDDHERLWEALNASQQDVYTVLPALKLIPKPIVGKDFEDQQILGRSISGLTFGLGVSSPVKEVNSSITATLGLNYILEKPERSPYYEGLLSLGLHTFVNYQPREQLRNALKWSIIGVELLAWDKVYASVDPVTFNGRITRPVYSAGLQFKPLSWDLGIRLGLRRGVIEAVPFEIQFSLTHF